jgi:hypothetical protein
LLIEPPSRLCDLTLAARVKDIPVEKWDDETLTVKVERITDSKARLSGGNAAQSPKGQYRKEAGRQCLRAMSKTEDQVLWR